MLDSDFVKYLRESGLANVGRLTLEDAGRFGALSQQRKQTDPENKRGRDYSRFGFTGNNSGENETQFYLRVDINASAIVATKTRR